MLRLCVEVAGDGVGVGAGVSDGVGDGAGPGVRVGAGGAGVKVETTGGDCTVGVICGLQAAAGRTAKQAASVNDSGPFPILCLLLHHK